MGPCRDFGEPGLEDIARLPVPSAMPAHVKSLAQQFSKAGAIPAEDASHMVEFVETLAIAPGYMRFLSAEKKRDEAVRLYDIARRLSPVEHPLRDDLLLAIGIILFNIDPSEKHVSKLSGLKPPAQGSPLSYEYHAMLAMNNFLVGSPEAAAAHAESALDAASGPDGRAYVRMLQACISLRQGDTVMAIKYLDDGENKNERLKALASFYSGIVRYERKDFDHALRYFEAAGAGAKDVMDVLAARCNVGACAVNMGDMGMGEKKFDTVGRLIRKKSGLKATRRELLANSYLGIIRRVQGEYTEAEEYYKKALRSSVQLKDSEGIANQLGNLGILYRHTGDHSMAHRLLNTCLIYSERMGYREGIRFSCENICRTLAETGQASEARKFKEQYSSRYPGLDL